MSGSNMKKALKIASVYIGTVLGAGFASGQELLQFFGSFGLQGIYGLLLAGVLFSLIGWAVLEQVYRYKFKNYQQFLEHISNRWIAKIMEVIVLLFMFTCFSIMLAGSGALLEQRFELPYYTGIILMAVGCFLTFLFDIKGVVAINTVLVPILFVGAFLLGIHVIFFKEVEVFASINVMKAFTHNWVLSSIIYVSYNAITAVVVLSSLYYLVDHRKTAKWAGIIGGSTLAILGLCLGVATLLNYGKIKGVEIPMLKIIMDYNPLIQYGYIIVLLAAMFTTAVANGYGVITRISSYVTRSSFSHRISVLIILVGMLMATVGFSEMVSSIYPLFGYLGLFQIVLILLHFVMRR